MTGELMRGPLRGSEAAVMASPTGTALHPSGAADRILAAHQEVIAIALDSARQVLQHLVGHLVVQGDTRGLDGDAPVLLILPCVSQALIASLQVGRTPVGI